MYFSGENADWYKKNADVSKNNDVIGNLFMKIKNIIVYLDYAQVLAYLSYLGGF